MTDARRLRRWRSRHPSAMSRMRSKEGARRRQLRPVWKDFPGTTGEQEGPPRRTRLSPRRQSGMRAPPSSGRRPLPPRPVFQLGPYKHPPVRLLSCPQRVEKTLVETSAWRCAQPRIFAAGPRRTGREREPTCPAWRREDRRHCGTALGRPVRRARRVRFEVAPSRERECPVREGGRPLSASLQ